jgi:hypothetical protein
MSVSDVTVQYSSPRLVSILARPGYKIPIEQTFITWFMLGRGFLVMIAIVQRNDELPNKDIARYGSGSSLFNMYLTNTDEKPHIAVPQTAKAIFIFRSLGEADGWTLAGLVSLLCPNTPISTLSMLAALQNCEVVHF